MSSNNRPVSRLCTPLCRSPSQQLQIQYETKPLTELDEKILENNDETGTVQVGWGRERGKYYTAAIYLRPLLACLKKALDNFMGHHRLRHMYISGPPGCGKTTYCLFYFTRYMLTENKKGLIVQYREKSTNEIMLLEGKCIKRVSTIRKNDDTVAIVREIIFTEGKDSFDFCIFDGVQDANDASKRISLAITSNIGNKTKIIKTTSLEFDIKGGDCTGGIDGIDDFFAVSSWTLEDYEKAVKAELMGLDELQRVLCIDSDFAPEVEDVKTEDEDETEAAQQKVEGDTKEVTFEQLWNG